MKKICLLTGALLALLTAQAQLERGRVLLGGGYSIDNFSTRNTGNDVTSWVSTHALLLKGGVFVRGNTLMALQLGSQNLKPAVETPYGHDFPDKEWLGGLLFRRYYPVGNRFYVHAEGTLTYVRIKGLRSRVGAPTLDLSSNNVSLLAGTGVGYAVGRRVLLEVSLGSLLGVSYTKEKGRNSSAGVHNETSLFKAGFGATGQLPLNIGFNLLLGK